MAENLANCTQPLVPERVFIAGGIGGNGTGGESSLTGGAAAGSGLMGLLLSLLVAEKSGFQLAELPAASELSHFTEQVTRQAMESIQQAVGVGTASTAGHNGNGAPQPASVASVITPSRLDGLDIKTDGA